MTNKHFQIQPVVQLRYKQILVYNKFEYEEGFGSSKVNYERHSLNGVKTYSGTVTKGAKKRMAKSIDTLLQISPMQKVFNPIINRYQNFQLTFLTVTISDDTKLYDAKYCYTNLLKPYLEVLKKKYSVESYIWKLELQERGQIHYHITTNKFILHTDVRNEWNMLQVNNDLLVDFKEKYGHTNPNSTDIHSVYKIRDIKKYLLKYLSKSSQNEISVKGKIWDCSENLKRFKPFEFYFDDITNPYFTDWYRHPLTEVFKNEHCEIASNPVLKVTKILNEKQRELFKQHIHSIKNYYNE